RVVEANGLALTVPAGGRRGSYLLQAFVLVNKGRWGLLQARLPGFARLKVDGTTVVERDPASSRKPRLLTRKIKLNAGWHRLTVLTTAGGREKVAVSLLDEAGKPLFDEVRAQPPSFPLVISAPKLGAEGIEAVGERHPYWLAGGSSRPERALFLRLLAASAALSRWLDDVETARAYLYALELAAPESAAVQSSMARLSASSRTPDTITQTHLRRALTLDPDHVGLLVSLGRRSQDQDPAGALKYAERAVALAPKAYAPRVLSYNLFRKKEWHAEAAEAIEQAADLGAPSYILSDGARYLRNTGQIEAAESMEALAITRAGGRRARLTAERAARRGDLAKAAELLAPGHRLQRAEWAIAQGHFDEAIKITRGALSKDPLAPRAERLLALALAARGDRESARQHLQVLRSRGQTSLAQEALAESLGDESLSGPPPQSWLGKSLKFDPRPLVAPLPGARRPRGLDASDRWAGHGQVQLLDRVVDRVQLDGSSISLRHSILRLQTKEATDRAGEINLPADALALDLRTLKPDGSTVDVDRHAGKQDLSFSALAPGDAVERRWVVIDGPASPYGGYLRRFFFQSTDPLVRSELAVIVPRGLKLKYYSYHGAPQPSIHREDDKVIYYWRANSVSPLVPEPHSPHPTEYVPFVVVTTTIDRTIALETRAQRTRSIARSSYDVVQTALSA
ncbi:MAG: DUF3857 domain-containing protein, partial [Myxococcota bacterium]